MAVVAPSPTPPPAPQGPRGRLRDRLLAVGFTALLAAPGLGLLAGWRPANIENRTLAAFPTVDAPSLLEPSFYAAIDRFVADQFPVRTDAVRIRATIDYGLLGGSTNPDVVVGRDGWLFPTDELDPPCRFAPPETLAQLDRVAARFQAAGVPVVFAVAPDKAAIYPERVDEPWAGVVPCTAAGRATLRAGFGERPAAVDLWDPVEAARTAAGDEPLYWLADTHWTARGALPAIERLVERLQPGAWDGAVVVAGAPGERLGDLSRLIGLPRTEAAPRFAFLDGRVTEREALPTTVVEVRGRELARFRVTGASSLVEGTTLIVHDSSFGVHAGLIAAWFEESVWLHVNELIEHPAIVEDLPPFDRIVVERVERLAGSRDYEVLLGPLRP